MSSNFQFLENSLALWLQVMDMKSVVAYLKVLSIWTCIDDSGMS